LDIGWPTDLSWYKLLTDWGGVIGGSLALAAGAGTIWAGMKSANRAIAVAQEQTKAALRQTAVMREAESRRLAREGYAFYVIIETTVTPGRSVGAVDLIR
jgi:hypothetical protein